MDLAKGEEAVAIAAIFDEGRLQRWLDPRYAGEIDIAAKLFLISRFEIEFFNPITAESQQLVFPPGGRHLSASCWALCCVSPAARKSNAGAALRSAAVSVPGQPDDDVSACRRPDATRRPFARRIAKTCVCLARFVCLMRILSGPY
jgi:hypothetical protein